MRRFRIATAVIATAVLLAGCGVSYDADLLASIEGRWMCDVQRYTFEEVGDIQAELDSRLAGNGVSAEQYRAFKDDLTKQPELRAVVETELVAYCDTGS
jgi:Ser/Thr protein kinase RdoA (MazF antagonist)